VIKVGNRGRNNRLVEGDYHFDRRIDDIGLMKLKSGFVRKPCPPAVKLLLQVFILKLSKVGFFLPLASGRI
jgi:hypothetical protein